MKLLKFNEYTALNEAFQSSKLRSIIQQHGLPKSNYDKAILYDLKDSEIVGAIPANKWEEVFNDIQDCFRIELKDGYYLVINNLDILRNLRDNKWDISRKLHSNFKDRRDQRHPDNQWNDIPKSQRDEHRSEIGKKFVNAKEKFQHKKNAEIISQQIGDIDGFVDKITDIVDKYIDGFVFEPDMKSDGFEEEDFTFNGIKFSLSGDFSISSSDYDSYGATYYNVTITPEKYEIWVEELSDGTLIEDSFDISELTGNANIDKLYDDVELNDIEGPIHDYYLHYGVNPENF